MKKNIFLRGRASWTFKSFLFLAFVLCLFSCRATSDDGVAFKLKNGIPVYYKNVDSTRMASVIICVKGGSLMFPREYSGIENELFELMSRGSEKYSYYDIKRLAYDTSVSISSSSSYAGSSFELSCISSYLDHALEVFLDCFLHPSFDQTQFDNMMTECDQSLQRMENDPESLLFYTMNKEIYKNHPLGTSSSVLPESRSNITIENIKEHYKKIIDAKRIFVVVAGDVNLSKLRRVLEKTLSKIPAMEEEFFIPDPPAFGIEGQRLSLKSPALAKGSGHIVVVFKSPALFSEDLIAARIVASMYNESLFNIVRTKYGACYTPSTSVGFSPDPYGVVFLYRVSDMEKAVSYIPEAQKNFLESDIEGNLKGYIKKYITSAYQNQMTCASIAGRSASALLNFGDIDAFDKLADSVKEVSADDVRRVFKTYWQSGEERIFDISGE